MSLLTRVLKTFRDGNGAGFSGRMRDDGTGNVAPEHHISGDDGSPLIGSVGDAAWDGNASNPSWHSLFKAMASKLLGSVAVTAASLPLPAGAATSSAQSTANSTLASILSTLQAEVDLTSSVWTDNSGAFYIRRESVNEGTGTVTVSYTDPTGSPATPGAGLRPIASSSGLALSQVMYDAVNSGTGYSAGDSIAHLVVVNQQQATVATSAWLNLTTGATISTPVTSDLVKVSQDVKLAAGCVVGGIAAIVGGTLTTPANTPTYALGQIIANSATPGSVTAIQVAVARINGGTGMVRRLRLKVNDAVWLNNTIRVHLYRDSPTCAAGDTGVWAGNTTESNYLGYCDIVMDRQFSDYVKGFGVVNVGSEINFDTAGGSQVLYALLESRSVVTRAASKIFSLVAEALPN